MSNEIQIFLRTKHGQEVMNKEKTRHAIPFEPDSVYYDHFCSVTTKCFIVKKYFIPSRLPYEFHWDMIREIKYTPQDRDDWSIVKTKGMDEEGRWWACDPMRTHPRELPLYNIRLECDSDPLKSGFSVIDIDEFLKACRPFLPYNCVISGCRWASE